jgi:hypothetical protein
MELTKNEQKVLELLAEGYDSSEWGETKFYPFDTIKDVTLIDREDIRRACRSLRDKGLAEYATGLWSDDGPGGSGYGATLAGATLISPCDVCGGLATSYFWVKDGKMVFNYDVAKYVMLCEEHYISHYKNV